jgi:hypothetical protein
LLVPRLYCTKNQLLRPNRKFAPKPIPSSLFSFFRFLCSAISRAPIPHPIASWEGVVDTETPAREAVERHSSWARSPTCEPKLEGTSHAFPPFDFHVLFAFLPPFLPIQPSADPRLVRESLETCVISPCYQVRPRRGHARSPHWTPTDNDPRRGERHCAPIHHSCNHHSYGGARFEH